MNSNGATHQVREGGQWVQFLIKDGEVKRYYNSSEKKYPGWYKLYPSHLTNEYLIRTRLVPTHDGTSDTPDDATHGCGVGECTVYYKITNKAQYYHPYGCCWIDCWLGTSLDEWKSKLTPIYGVADVTCSAHTSNLPEEMIKGESI